MPSPANLLQTLAGAIALFVAAAIMQPIPSEAGPKIAIGTLKCNGRGGVGLILGSKELMHCVFTTAISGRRYPYLATITKVGLDIGYKSQSTLLWSVLGPTIEIPDNALIGSYGGLTAGVALGIGGNANALIGGFGQSILLQPLSLEGQTGVNFSAGVAGLVLEPG